MPSPLQTLIEPVTKLAQANMSTWTQFWMSPDQPWAMAKVDLFGAKPAAPSLPVPDTGAVTKLWSGLVENQQRFFTDLTQQGTAMWKAAPDSFRQASGIITDPTQGTSA
jgi:hypothetical protein